VSTGKLFQMLTTRSLKNEEQAVQLECRLYSLQGWIRVWIIGCSVSWCAVQTHWYWQM